MGIFLQIVWSFPTAIFTVLLAVIVLYWLVAITGLMEVDALDNLLLPNDDGMELGALAALLNRLGLGGVPLTIIVSLISLFAWMASFAGVRLLLGWMDVPGLNLLLGAVIFAVALVLGLVLTIIVLRPVRQLLRKVPAETSQVLLGRVGVVRSAVVSPEQGYATIEDGGAGLVLQVRTVHGELPRGARVVLIERLPATNAWRVVSEDEFSGQ